MHLTGLHRQLTWARAFARAGDLASALDALGDAGALAQELGHRLDPIAAILPTAQPITHNA